MEIAHLFLDYVHVLAWPIVLLTTVILFRVQLGSLVGRVTEASAFGTTVKLESQAKQVQEAVASFTPAETAETRDAKGSPEDDGTSSVGKIVRAWAEVETVSKRLFEQLGHPPSPGVFVLRTVSELAKKELISSDAVGAVRELRGIRNKLIHDPGVVLTASAADSLLIAIKDLRNTLENISVNFPNS